MKKLIKLEFNPDVMKVSDLKKAAETLRTMIAAHNRNPDDVEGLYFMVANAADVFTV